MAKRKKSDQRQALESPQSAEVGWLQHQFAEHPVRGLTPAKLHQLLTNAEQGDLTAQADLFCDMEERDTHIFSDMSKRKRSVVGLDWGIKPCRNASPAEKKLAEEVAEWVGDIEGFDQIIFDALDAVGHAYSAQEIKWHRLGALWLPECFEFKEPRMFQTPLLSPNELRLRDGSADGAELWPYGWMLHVHKAKSGYIARSGLHRVLSWPFLFKHYGVRDLMEFLEIYGLPMRLGKYPSGATDDEKGKLLRAVMSIGHHAAGIIPQGMQIDFQEAAKGTSDPHMALIEWCERSQSKAILGGTLTSSEGSHGTQALGNVHNEVRRELTESDAKQLAATINQYLIVPMLQLNKPELDPTKYPKFYFDLAQPEDITTYSEALPKLVDIGMKIPQQWAHEKLGIPMPDSLDVAVLAKPKPQPTLTTAANSQLLPLLYPNIAANTQRQPTEAELLMLQAARDEAALETAANSQLTPERLEQQGQKLLAPLLDRLNQAGGIEQALELLATLKPDQDLESLQDDLTQLMFAAEVWGRLSDAGQTDV